MNLSIIVPYHKEGREFITTTIDNIESTIDVDKYEIIVVDDGSDAKKRWFPSSVHFIKHISNLGVGAAFDTGVNAAISNNIILMGCDIRFKANQWASQMIEEIRNHPKGFTCSACINLNAEKPENLDLDFRRKISMFKMS